MGEGVRVLPDGSRIVPKTLCIWCEKPLADGRPVTPPIASESDPADKRAWHVECLDAWEASLEGDGPAEEGS